MIRKEYYEKLEKCFVLNYPKSSNATYTSLLNYSKDLSSSKQRWYRYKEGFSIELVRNIIKDNLNKKNAVILDPFVGSGTTVIGANSCGCKGIGFEVNPFTFFLAQLKTKTFSRNDTKKFTAAYKKIINANFAKIKGYKMPKVSFANKIFPVPTREKFMKVRTLIESYKGDVKQLLLLGWISIIEDISNYRKAGNGLKFKTPSKRFNKNVLDLLDKKYSLIRLDISNKKDQESSRDIKNLLIFDTSLNLRKYINDNSIDGVIFSPPYANCFDYTEIYKLELWLGGFVNNKKDIKELRKKAIRSNLNYLDCKFNHRLDNVERFTKEMDSTLWDSKIPTMLKCYFDDMYTLLDNLKFVLKKKAFCCIVIGNSAYGGVVIPTDLLLADYARKNGYIVHKIDIYRYLIPSSQQYEKTKKFKKYIRESVICLEKNG